MDITFNNCILWFTTNGVVGLSNNQVLFDCNNSTLQASCDWWWGVSAGYSKNIVQFQHNSKLKNAEIGVMAYHNAWLDVTNTTFEDNGSESIRLFDVTDPNYHGVIQKSIFTTQQNLPGNYSRMYTGIHLKDVAKMDIGNIYHDDLGNSFSNMYTGIRIVNSTGENSDIGIYNCKFQNIHNQSSGSSTPDMDMINNTYTTPLGAAIFSTYLAGSTSPKFNLDVRNTNAANSSIAFDHCDKGIVAIETAVRAEKLYMDNVPLGIMNYNPFTQTQSNTTLYYQANNNKLYHTFIGMQFAGEKDNSEVKTNTIECNYAPNGIPTATANEKLWPKGIDVSYFLNTGSSAFNITDGNTITIPGYAGIGIALSNAGSGVSVKDNTINLSQTGSAIQAYNNASILAGIVSSTALGARIHRNTINGYTASSTAPNNTTGRVDACGILIDKGDEQAIGCNSINNTRFGLLGWGQNNASPACSLKVQGNTVLGSDAGWVLRHLSNEGTLGNIGNPSNDNNNLFPTLIGGPKIFKFCMGNVPDKIYTTSIDPFIESLSQDWNNWLNTCVYQITANPGATVFNNIAECGGLQIMADDVEIRIDEALAIATDTKVYAEFPALGHWYDSKRLYDYLTRNPSIKNQYSTLISFYDAMTNDAIAQERLADLKLRDLIESFAILSPSQREGVLEDAGDITDDIDVTVIQNSNEQRINTIYLRMIRFGVDSISLEDWEFIHLLAPQCPYIGGSAVYKARTLNYFLEPSAMYDDMKACNAIGVYKPGSSAASTNSISSLITTEDEALSRIKSNQDVMAINQVDFIVYPKPTSGVLHVQYQALNQGELKIMDITGRVVKSVLLPKGENKLTFDIDGISSGVYTYKHIVSGSIQHSGKLIKE